MKSGTMAPLEQETIVGHKHKTTSTRNNMTTTTTLLLTPPLPPLNEPPIHYSRGNNTSKTVAVAVAVNYEPSWVDRFRGNTAVPNKGMNGTYISTHIRTATGPSRGNKNSIPARGDGWILKIVLDSLLFLWLLLTLTNFFMNFYSCTL